MVGTRQFHLASGLVTGLGSMCGGNFKKGGKLRAQSGKRTYSDKRVAKIQVQSRSECQHGHASKSKSSKDDELW